MNLARTIVNYLVLAWVIVGGLLVLAGFVGWLLDAFNDRKRTQLAASRPRGLHVARSAPTTRSGAE